MRQRSLTWRVFRYNSIVILVFVALTTVTFNVAVRYYVEQDIVQQLERIAARAHTSAVRPFPFPDDRGTVGGPGRPLGPAPQITDDLFLYYIGLDRALREPLTVLNADYIFLSLDKEPISFLPTALAPVAPDVTDAIVESIARVADFAAESHVNFSVSGQEFIAYVKPAASNNPLGIGWIVIYSGLQKLNQLQRAVNGILGTILVVGAVVSSIVSSLLSRRITAPFATLSHHIKAIASRNFGTKIDIPVDVELQPFMHSVNTMSEKLAKYDKAQKTFLQNASHEFRTPLMAIQSYAEGLKHRVVAEEQAIDVILEEAERLRLMVEELLYLSRLDAIEESYSFTEVPVVSIVEQCVQRALPLAAQVGKNIEVVSPVAVATVRVDEDRINQALFNVIGNCLRYATSTVWVETALEQNDVLLAIRDDGPGISEADIPHVFERFYKGERGNVGLGLAISENIVRHHNGTIHATSSPQGAAFHIRLPTRPG